VAFCRFLTFLKRALFYAKMKYVNPKTFKEV